MYVSRLAFHTLPGKTHEVEQGLLTAAGYSSGSWGRGTARAPHALCPPWAPRSVVFEQEAPDLATWSCSSSR